MSRKSVKVKPKKLSLQTLRKDSYNQDFFKWTLDQSAFLKHKDFSKLDIENLVEEIESLGRTEKRTLKSHLANLLLHLLKKEYQPEKLSKSWEKSILNSKLEVKDCLADNPSLKKQLKVVFDEAYQKARAKASLETNLDIKTFPKVSPWSMKEIL